MRSILRQHFRFLFVFLFIAISSQSIAQTPQPAGGLKFDGVDDYVSLTNPTVANLKTFTVEAWVKPGATSGTIYSEGLTSSLSPMFSLIHTPNGTNGFEIVLRNTSEVGLVVGTTNGSLPINQWSHVAFVRTSATTAQLYINGALTDNFTFADPGFIDLNVANLGTRQRSNKEYFFTGSMDEVRIWNRALCQAEIQNNKNCELNAAGQTGLISLYHFNQGLADGNNAPLTVPGAPFINNVTGGNSSAAVNFTAPASDGGSAITSYTVTSNPGGLTATGSSSPVTIGGLTNGVAYTFTVAATNAVGSSAASAASEVAVVPTGVPTAPENISVAPGTGNALVSFSAPVSDGGLAITSYTITAQPGGTTATGSSSPVLISGLTNGTSYTFTVVATNAAGSSASSVASSAVMPVGAPSAPLITAVYAGDGQAVVSFNPPASNGGHDIASYTVTSSPGNVSVTGAGSPLTITGLTNGQTYTFTVIASNDLGSSQASAPSNPSTPLGAPSAPQNVTVNITGTQALVSFSEPTSNGGLPVTQYTVTANPGGMTASAASSPITIPGLVAGVTYTFTVTAINVAGTSVPSEPSAPATVSAVPGAPSILSVTAGSGQVSIEFAPPASDGGSAITSYTVTSSPGGITATGSSSPVTISGLTNGTAYTFTVQATNANGSSVSSAASASATPQDVPAAPTGVSAVLSGTSAVVSFTAPANNGGSPITSYRVESSTGGLTVTSAGSPITVPGLVAGTSYTFTVVAINAIGSSVASAASAPVVIPVAPGAPTIASVAPGNSQVTVQFQPPASNGGSPITSYTVVSTPGNLSASGAGSPLTVTGLVNGTSYTFRARATTAFGVSALSAASSAVIPKGPPAAPTTVIASQSGSAGDRASVAFTAPVNNGGSPVTSYRVTSTPGGFFATGASSPIIVTGLTAGVTYRFTVTATNVVGTSPASAQSNAFVPTGLPGAPTITSATAASNTTATIGFSPPASNGGLTITSYTVTSNPGGITANGGSSPIVVSGLTNGLTYTFTVKATNSKGSGASSAASNAVTMGGTAANGILLVYSPSLGQYLNAVTGNVFNQTDGSETDPLDGSVKVNPYPAGSVPPFIVTPQDKLYVSFDAISSGRYYTYRYSYVDQTQMLEFDRNAEPFATVAPPLYVITSDLKVVDIYDGASDNSYGILRDPVTGVPFTGAVEAYTALQTPGIWLLPAPPTASVNKNNLLNQSPLITATLVNDAPSYVTGPYDYSNTTPADHIELSGNITTAYITNIPKQLPAAYTAPANNISITTSLVDETGNNNGTLNGFALTGSNSNWSTGIASGVCAAFVAPATPITGSNQLCAGKTVQLSNATAGGTWSSNNETVATVSAVGLVSGLTEGTAIISYSNLCGGVSSLTVTVKPLPTISGIIGNTTICNGSSVSLTATSDAPSPSFRWCNSPAAGASIFISSLTYNAVLCVGVTSNGCTSAVNFSVPMTVLPVPNVSVVKTDVTCEAGNNGKITVSATGVTGALEYSKDGGAVYQSSNIFNGLAAGTYTIVVKSAAGCVSANSVVVIGTTPDTTPPSLVGVPANTTAECSAIPAMANVTASDNCLVNGSVNAEQFPTSTLKASLVHSYTFNSSIADSKGSANGTNMNGVSFAPGIMGNAAQFSGSNYLDYGTAASLNGTIPFAISVWIKTASAGGQTIIQQRDGNFNGQYILNIGANHAGTISVPGQVYFMVYNNGFQFEIYSSNRVDDNKWHHIVAERDGGNGRVFVDGVLVGSATGPLLALSSGIGTYVGRDVRDGSKNFVGQMDELKIFAGNGTSCTSTYDLERTWSIADASGNMSAAQQIISVQDTQAPVLSAAPANATVECNAVPAAATLTATDCSATTITYAEVRTNGSSVNNYTLTRTWTATDACGNTSNKTQVITVQDTQLPLIAAPSNVVVTLTNGNCIASGVVLGTPVTSDNCGVASVINDAPATYSLGSTIVTWTVKDNSNNIATATQTVTVVSPEINVTGNSVSIVKGDGTPAVSDNTDFGGTLPGSPVVKTFTIQNTGTSPLTVSSIGISGTNAANFTLSGIVFPNVIAANESVTFNVTFNATDIATKTAIVTINNNDCDEVSYDFAVKAVIACAAPSFANVNVYIQNSTSASGCTAVVTYPLSVNGTAPVVNYTFTGATTGTGTGTGSGQVFNKGITHVVVTATNGCGTPSTAFDVTVVDDVKPTVITKNNTIYLDATGRATLNASSIDNGSSDNCSAVSFMTNSNGIICATAAEGSYLTLTAPAGKVITGINFASYGNPTGSCGNFVTGSCHASNSLSIVSSLAIGRNSVTIGALNSVFNDPCNGTVKRLYVEATYASIGTSNVFTCSKLGNNEVTLIVTDADGNTESGTAIVTVVDSTRPVVRTRNLTLCLDANGNANITAAMIENGSTDNCSIVSYSLNQTSFNSSHVGVNTVTLSVRDASGNIGTATATVTINALPVVYAVTGGGAYCIGSEGVAVGLSNSQTGVTYRLYDNYGNNVASVSGTGAAINFGTQTVAGTYTVYATNATGECGMYMSGAASVTVNAIPVITVTPAASTICAGNSVVLTAAQTQTQTKTYKVALSDLLNTPNNCSGDSWYGNDQPGFRWYDEGTGAVSNVKIQFSMGVECNSGMVHTGYLNNWAQSAYFSQVSSWCSCGNPPTPAIVTLNMSGDGYVVGGENTFNIYNEYYNWMGFIPDASLDNSFALVTVTYGGGSASGNVNNWVWTPGGANTTSITVNPAATTTYTVTGTDVNGCRASATATVTVNPLPAVQTVTGGGITCGSGVAIGLSGSQTGIRYQLRRNGSNTGSPVNGNGGAINFAVQSAIGTYTVIATNASTSCTVVMSGNAVITSGTAPVFANTNASIQAFTTATTCNATVTYPLSISGTPAPTVNYTFTGATTGNGTGTGSGATFNKGVTHVAVVAANGCGTRNYNFDVTVTDNTVPTITAPATITVNTDAGKCGATVTLGNAITADNCGVATVTNNGASFITNGLYPVGTTTVTWTVTDNSGLAATATQLVVVTDNEKPIPVIATLPTINGECSASVSRPTATDNCAGTVTATTNDPLTYHTQGTYTITWTYTDTHNNTETQTQTVIVQDVTPPTIACSSDINVFATSAAGAVVSYAVPVGTDNCSVANTERTAGLETGSTFPIGTTTVTYTVTDIAGLTASCSFDVTVAGLAPQIICPENIVVNNDANKCGAVVNYAATETTAIPASIITYSIAPGSFFPVGTTTVTATATNAVGSSVCTFTVTVIDTEKPTITAPGEYGVANSPAQCGAILTSIGTPETWDNCGVASVTNDHPSTFYPVGETIVTWTVTDIHGNVTDTAKQLIRVVDNERPTVITQNITIHLDATGTASITPEQIDNHSTDNCGIASISLNKITFDCSNTGANTVILTVTDIHGHTATKTAVVTVLDIIAPVLVGVPANSTVECNAIPAAAVVTATDNCSGISVVLNETRIDGDCPNTYTLKRTWTATDPSGNATSQSQTITVQDTQKPVLSAAPANVTVECNAVPAAAILTATDNCSTPVVVYAETRTNGNCSGNYTLTRTWTATDACGNSCSKTQVITVQDTQSPVLSVAPANVTVECNAVPAAAVLTATDNCSTPIVIYTQTSTQHVSTTNPGYYNYTITRTWTATDVCGNTASKTQVITVQDKTNPVITACPVIPASCDNLSGNSKTVTLTATDNCGPVSITYNLSGATVLNVGTGASLTKNFNIGTTVIVWTVKDVSGNTSSCSTTVVVNPLPVASITAANADAFCNKFILTGNSTLNGPFGYQWLYNNQTAGSSQQLTLSATNADGVYTLYTTDANGCRSAAGATYNYQKQNLVSSYTILTYKDAELGKYNKVASGSVGVMTYSGEAEFKSYSSVNGAGSFVKAPRIDKEGYGINITTQIFGLASVALPTMQYNTASTKYLSSYTVAQNAVATLTANYNNLKVKKGATVTVTGSIFGTIDLEAGASIRFTNPVLNIDKLLVDDGAKDGYYSYISFAPNTSVRISSSVSIGSQVRLNQETNKVTFYMGDTKPDEEKFTVRGGDTRIIANVFMPNGKLRVTATDSDDDDHDNCDHRAHNERDCRHKSHGHKDCNHRVHNASDCNDDVYMAGLFIAEEVESKGNTVIWNNYDCSAPPTQTITSAVTTKNTATVESLATTATAEEELKITVMPNPSTTFFTLKLESKYETPVTLRVMDGTGRVVDAKSKIGANSTIQIGHNYSSGTYYAELIQGTKRKVVQLIKGRG